MQEVKSSADKQLKIGAILSYTAIFINIVAGLIYTPWMVRKIGDSDYGLYTLANSLITLFLVDFGLSSATSRYLSKYRAEGNQEKIDNFLGAIYKLYLIITSVIFVVLLSVYFFIDVIYTNLTPSELEKFKIVYIISASFAVINFPFVTFNGILTAYEKFIPLKLADIIYRVLFVVSTAIALILGYGLYALVALHALLGLLIILYKFVVIKKSVPIAVNFSYSDGLTYKEIFSFSIWVTVDTLAQRLIFNITPSILGIVADTTAIAIFGIITTIEAYIYTVISAINGMFMPKISNIIQNDEKQLNPLFLKVGKYLYALNGVIVVGFFVIGREFIDLWIGADYALAYWGILLVIIPGMFYNPLQIANTTMIATKKVNIRAYVTISIGLINIFLSFLLSSRFGVIGACFSIFISYILRAIVLNIIYHKVLPLNIGDFIKNCYLKMSIPVIFSIFLSFIICNFIEIRGWIGLFLKGGLCIGIYAIFLLVFGINKADRGKIFGFLKKLKKG